MTPEEFAAKMQKCFPAGYDRAIAHREADLLMCDLLTILGYGEGVTIFHREDKWYE